MKLTATTARELTINRQRIRASIGGGKPVWVQAIYHDAPYFYVLISTNMDTRIRKLTAADLPMFEIDDSHAAVEVEPLRLATGVRIDTAEHGHNGIAEALLMLSIFGIPAAFRYSKPKALAEQRTVKITWADGDRFGGQDYARDMAARSFRLDRVSWVELAPNALHCPIWVGTSYERGLP